MTDPSHTNNNTVLPKEHRQFKVTIVEKRTFVSVVIQFCWHTNESSLSVAETSSKEDPEDQPEFENTRIVELPR